MWRLISAAVRANTSSRSSEAFTSSPISVSVASTSAEISAVASCASVVCSSVVLMRHAHYIRSARAAQKEITRLYFFPVRAERQHAHVQKISVAFGIVQPVSHHKFIGNLEAYIIGPHLGDATLRFIQQNRHAQSSRLAL